MTDSANQFDAEASKAINKLFPKRGKNTNRESFPGYIEELPKQKRVFQNKNSIWK